MRYALGVAMALAAAGCSSSGGADSADASIADGALDGPHYVFQPDGAAQCSDEAHCIWGTAVLGEAFGAMCPGKPSAHCCPSSTCPSWQVFLFDQYPYAGSTVQPIAQTLVAQDDTWSFDGVGADGGASSTYYVQAAADFVFDGGTSGIASQVGPITLPLAAPVAVTVLPGHAEAYESRGADAGMALDWVIARIFDPRSGVEITSGAKVEVLVGDASTPLTPTVLAPDPTPVWYAAFAPPVAARPTYTVTASHPAFDGGLVLPLVADPPSFDGTIASVDAGANGIVNVVWAPGPPGEYETLELYPETPDGGVVTTPVYMVSSPGSLTATSGVTSPLAAGAYLVNVAYTRANCPADAGGCVQAATVAARTTAVP
ncbi:MAG: hypothetical protein ACRENE_34255 [Polyangiaceae bacterium]